jgi:hypothetical protein
MNTTKARARAEARRLVSVRVHVGASNLAFAFGEARALARAEARRLVGARDPADAENLARVEALADALADARADARALARHFPRCRSPRGLAADRRRRGRALDRNLTGAFTYVEYFTPDLAKTLIRAEDLTRSLLSDLSDLAGAENLALAEDSRQPGARRVVPSAASLLTTAARPLPAAHRSRYAAEYQSELWDLARAGAGHIRQLRYALCQLRNALPMSIALRSPRRRSSAP